MGTFTTPIYRKPTFRSVNTQYDTFIYTSNYEIGMIQSLLNWFRMLLVKILFRNVPRK